MNDRRQRLIDASRLYDALLKHERPEREDEYLRLFEQQVVCVSRGRSVEDATEAHLVLARVATSKLWLLAREASTALVIHRFTVSRPYFEGRRNLKLELSDRGEIQAMMRDQIEGLYDLADEIHDRVEGVSRERAKPKFKVVGGTG